MKTSIKTAIAALLSISALSAAHAATVTVNGQARVIGQQTVSDGFNVNGAIPGGGTFYQNNAAVTDPDGLASVSAEIDGASGIFRLAAAAELDGTAAPFPIPGFTPADARGDLAASVTLVASGSGTANFLLKIDGAVDISAGANGGAGGSFALLDELGSVLSEASFDVFDNPEEFVYLSVAGLNPGDEVKVEIDFSVFASARNPGAFSKVDFGNTLQLFLTTTGDLSLSADGSAFFSNLEAIPVDSEVPLPAAAFLFLPVLAGLAAKRRRAS